LFFLHISSNYNKVFFGKEEEMKKLVIVFVAASLFLCCGLTKATTSVSIYADSINVNTSSPIWQQVDAWSRARAADIRAATPIVNMSNGTYPGTTTMLIDDELVDMINWSNEIGSGKCIAFIFDVATDVEFPTNFRVQQLFTQTLGDSRFDQNNNDVTANFDSAQWINIGLGEDDEEIGGHVIQGYYCWWDRTADTSVYSQITNSSLFVRYSTDAGATWSTPTSLTVTVIPEPATISLLVLGTLGLIRKK
jgi:hypothetical protein